MKVILISSFLPIFFYYFVLYKFFMRDLTVDLTTELHYIMNKDISINKCPSATNILLIVFWILITAFQLNSIKSKECYHFYLFLWVCVCKCGVYVKMCAYVLIRTNKISFIVHVLITTKFYIKWLKKIYVIECIATHYCQLFL